MKKQAKKRVNMTTEVSRFILALALDGRSNWREIRKATSAKFGGIKFNNAQWKRMRKLSEKDDPLAELDRLVKHRADYHQSRVGRPVKSRTANEVISELQKFAATSIAVPAKDRKVNVPFPVTAMGVEKISADTPSGRPASNGRSEVIHASKLNLDVNVTDEIRLWDTLEAIVHDTVGGDKVRDLVLSHGEQLDHNDFAVLRDVADVALSVGNVSHNSEEYGKALTDLIQRIRHSHI